MTIREAFKEAMDLTPEEILVIDGKKSKARGVLPLPVSYCFETIALILYIDATMRAGEKPNEKVLEILKHDESTYLISLSQFLQLSGFLEWWFDQEAKWIDFDDDGNQIQNNWWDVSEIVGSWNRYANLRNQGVV